MNKVKAYFPYVHEFEFTDFNEAEFYDFGDYLIQAEPNNEIGIGAIDFNTKDILKLKSRFFNSNILNIALNNELRKDKIAIAIYSTSTYDGLSFYFLDSKFNLSNQENRIITDDYKIGYSFYVYEVSIFLEKVNDFFNNNIPICFAKNFFNLIDKHNAIKLNFFNCLKELQSSKVSELEIYNKLFSKIESDILLS
ncbi:MAG: hypothetical protein LC122_11815 [Chitinophagales bacterium]|nr:hypothetical protein [Chitinophagales bacterium]